MSLDFPSSPTNGQYYEGFVYDSASTVWKRVSSVSGESSLPAGVILAWGTNTPPANWLICDGSAVSRTTYSTLFSVIGTTFGVGDGSTTFNLPDLRGRVIVGRDSGQTEFDALGEAGGAKTHTHPLSNAGQAKITITSGNVRIERIEGAGFTRNVVGTTTPSTSSGAETNSTGLQGETDAASTLQPYQVTNYIIKISMGVSAGDSEYINRLVAAEGLTARNLIRNARLRVNQRAWTSGSSVANLAFFLDGWTQFSGGATTLITATGSEDAGRVLTIGNSANQRPVRQTIEQRDVIPGEYIAGNFGTSQVRVYKVGDTPPAYASGPVSVTLDGTGNVAVDYTNPAGASATLDRPFLVRASAWSGRFPDISYADDLSWCRRFYYRLNVTANDQALCVGQVYQPSGTSFGVLKFPVTMRAIPTVSWSGTASSIRAHQHGVAIANATAVAVVAGSMSTEGVEIQLTHSTSGWANGGAVIIQGTSASTSYFEASADI